MKHLDPCFPTTLVKSIYLEVLLEKIWRIQIQMLPQTSFEPIYGAFTLKNKIIAHGLGLIV